jgi:REP element-mobilizing transposase RayT
MPRQPREQAAGLTYHVMARSTFGRRVFLVNDDRRYFEFRLEDVVRRFEWSVKAHCLMGTHYHLLVTTPKANLAEGIHRLNGLHAQAFNHRHDEFGHLFRSRYQSVIVEAEGHLLELLRYLALNPVRAGLCAHPRDWRWSSYAAAIGWAAPAPFLDLEEVLLLFANDRAVARDRLQEFVESVLNGAKWASSGD